MNASRVLTPAIASKRIKVIAENMKASHSFHESLIVVMASTSMV